MEGADCWENQIGITEKNAKLFFIQCSIGRLVFFKLSFFRQRTDTNSKTRFDLTNYKVSERIG